MDGPYPAGNICAGTAIIAVVAETVYLAWFRDSRVCTLHSLGAVSSSYGNYGRVRDRFRHDDPAVFGGNLIVRLCASEVDRLCEA